MKKFLFYILILCYSITYAQTIEDAKILYKNKEYKKAIDIFQKFPKDSESQFYLAKSYLYGNGIEKNYSKALDFVNKSANQNNADSYNLLGIIYENGWGIEKDVLAAIMYYKKAMEFNNPSACINIGRIYEEGNIFQKNLKEAEKYYIKSIELEAYQGYIYLGQLYRDKIKDFQKAEKYFQKAVDYNIKDGYYFVASLNLNHIKNFNKAIEYYKKAIENKIFEKESYFFIAKIYAENFKNFIEAEEYYKKAIELNYNPAFVNLANLYQYIKKDYLKAEEYYKKAIDINDWKAYFELGLLYQYHKKDYKLAEIYYIKSIENNDVNSYFQLADLYHYDIKNTDKAIEYYIKSIEKNETRSFYRLGLIYQYITKDYLKAEEYYKKAIDVKDQEAYLQLGQLYHYNLKKYEEALELYNKSLEYKKSNYTYALLGDLYKFHFKKYDKSIENYLKAIEYGIPKKDAFPLIANIYDENLNDYDKAIEYYLKAKNLGNKDSSLLIGMIYDYKLEQYDKAIKYYQEAINDGNTRAYFQLATLYDLKLKDYTNAEKYYQNAIEHGDKYSYKSLAYLYLDMGEDKKAENFIQKAIEFNKNLNQCEIADFYKKIDSTKAYDIAINEISKKREGKELEQCYSFLGKIYSRSNGSIESVIPIDYKKSIKYFELASKYSSIVTDYFDWTIGDLYAEYGDKEKAKEWYKKAYAINSDSKYTNKINDLKVDINTNSNINIFPFLDLTIFRENLTKHFLYEESARYCFFPTTNQYIQMYDKEDKKLKNEFRWYKGSELIEYIIDIVADEKKNIIYTTTNQLNQINIFDLTSAKLIDYIKLKNHKNSFTIEHLHLSEDGRILVAYNNDEINIIDTKTKEQQFYPLNFQIFLKDILISKIEDDYIINILTSDSYLHTFSFNKKRKISKDLFINQVNFKPINDSQCIKLNDKSLISKNILELYPNDNFLYISTDKNDNYKFDMTTLELQNSSKIKIDYAQKSKLEVKVVQNGSIVEIYENENIISEIPLLEFGYTYSKVLNNEFILILTKNLTNQLIFDKYGKLLVKLKGNYVLQTSAYFNKGFLCTYGKDNLIHIFNVSDLSTLSKKEIEYLSSETKRLIDEEFDDKFILDLFSSSSPRYLGFIPTLKQVQNFALIEDGQKVKIKKPIVSLYIKNEKDWIIYTPEGLFTYGGEGYKLLKYHQNQGLYKEAKIIENEKLFDKFYRPDLIKKILAGEKVDIPLDVKAVIQNIKAPELSILSNKMLNEKDIDLTYQICDAGNGIADPKIIINGQSINPPTSRGFSIERIEAKDDNCKVYNSIHTLNPGTNIISIKAYDKDKYIANESQSIEITTNYNINNKPNLYFLSIAISDYEVNALDLKYPVKDVLSVKEKIQIKSKSIYENIFTYTIHDSEVTNEKIDNTFDEISKKIKINDVFILYIAGHGVSKDGLYQFIPYKSNEKISIYDFKQNLSKILTPKSLVLLDTCQSGAALENIDDEATKNRLSYDSNINYIVASSSNQVALEGYKDHGVFTYSVLDAFDKNDKLKVWGLADYVSEEVPKITQEKFHFQQVPQAKLNKNFALSDE